MNASSSHVVVLIEKTLDFVHKNQKQVLAGVVGVAVVVAAVVGFSFYRTHVNEQAHKALLQALKYYDAPVGKVSYDDARGVSFSSLSEKWKKNELVFKQGCEKYSRTTLAPIFLSYQSEALLNQGKLDEAIKTLTIAVGMIENAAVKDLYRIKLALMMLDSNNELERQQGLGALTTIADNKQSPVNESALYQLGAYYWSEKKFAQAQTYWQMLLVKYGANDSKQPSQYAEIVKEKLASLSPESL